MGKRAKGAIMLTLEQCRAAVTLDITDDELIALRDMIYETCYGFLGAINSQSIPALQKERQK
jgi:hypothetical protein